MEPPTHQAMFKAALVGTARSSEPARTGAPTDELVRQAGVEGAEKELLLAAGTWSVWRLAGRKPDLLPELPEAAPAETRPVCSPRAAEVLKQVIDGPYRMLLPEAGRLLAEAGRLLPPALLPSALSLPKTYRGELRQALGERGVWLARMEPVWSWVVSGDAGDETEAIPTDADRLWEEGSHEQREALLRRVRQVDPGRARDWLMAGFAKEKADRRAALLETFAIGLGPDDEPFLDKALDDRSQQVRAAAAPLLARLPGSAYAARLRERADAMLTWEEPEKPSGLLGKVGALLGDGEGSKGKLRVEPPQEVDTKTWERDGIPATPPQGVGKRAFWLTRILSRIPPAHWEQRFGRTPAELVAAARETEWQGALLEGWARAALDFGSPQWMAPLWDAGRDIRKDFGPGALPELRPLRPELLAAMPAAEQEERIARLLGDPSSEEGPLDLYLRRLAQPWKPAFAALYLQGLRAAAEAAFRGGTGGGAASGWLGTIPLAAAALPEERFDAAQAPWPAFDTLDRPDWSQRSWIDKLRELEDILHLRRTLRKEIVP